MPTVRTFPFDAVGGSPSYGAAAVRDVIQGLATNGVVAAVDQGLAVVASTPNAMTVEIQPGIAFLQGAVYRVAAGGGNVVLSVPANTSGATRQDYVVLRYDLTASPGNITAAYKTGTASPPTLTRTTTQWEIALAQVNVPNNATAISQAQIVDTRGSQSVCGYAQVPFQTPALPALPGFGFTTGTLRVVSVPANNGTYAPPSGSLALVQAVTFPNVTGVQPLQIGTSSPQPILFGPPNLSLPLTLPLVLDANTPLRNPNSTSAAIVVAWELPAPSGVQAWWTSLAPPAGSGGTFVAPSSAALVLTRAYYSYNTSFTLQINSRIVAQPPSFIYNNNGTTTWATGSCGYVSAAQQVPLDPLPWSQPLIIPAGTTVTYYPPVNSIQIVLSGYTVPSGWALNAS
jgi:hypothetical protein